MCDVVVACCGSWFIILQGLNRILFLSVFAEVHQNHLSLIGWSMRLVVENIKDYTGWIRTVRPSVSLGSILEERILWIVITRFSRCGLLCT